MSATLVAGRGLMRAGLLLACVLVLLVPAGCSADCGWSGAMEAFVDRNANAKWDSGEPPLAGVTFHVDDLRTNSLDTAQAVSDNSGRASISFFASCGEDAKYAVIAEPAEGYRPTTPWRVYTDWKMGKTFTFGFAASK